MSERLDKYRDADPTDPAEDVAFANAVAVAMNGTAAGLFAHGPVPQGGPSVAHLPGESLARAALGAARSDEGPGPEGDGRNGYDGGLRYPQGQ